MQSSIYIGQLLVAEDITTHVAINAIDYELATKLDEAVKLIRESIQIIQTLNQTTTE
jgi:hypothetical protein